MVLLRSGTDRWLVAELIFVSFSTCRLSPFFSELLNRYCNSSRKEKAGERTCSRPQGSYISLAAGAFYKMFSYKQFNFATGTSASLYLNSFVSFHGKTGVCPLSESVEEHESVFQKAGSCDSDSSRAFNNNLLYYSDFLLLSLNLLKHSQWSAAQSSPTLASNLRS